MGVEVAIGGAGPAGMTAGYYLAKEGVKTVIFERNLCPSGGIIGGRSMWAEVTIEILQQVKVS